MAIGEVMIRQKCAEKSYAICWPPPRKILSREMAIRERFMIFWFSSSQNTSKWVSDPSLLSPSSETQASIFDIYIVQQRFKNKTNIFQKITLRKNNNNQKNKHEKTTLPIPPQMPPSGRRIILNASEWTSNNFKCHLMDDE